MRQNIYEFIQTNEEMRNYLRIQPAWYKRLTVSYTHLTLPTKA